MNAQREELITTLAVASNQDPENQEVRGMVDAYITETHAKEARLAARAKGLTKLLDRGMITVAELHQRLGAILEDPGA